MKVIPPKSKAHTLQSIPVGGCFTLASVVYMKVHESGRQPTVAGEVLCVDISTGHVSHLYAADTVYPVNMTAVEGDI